MMDPAHWTATEALRHIAAGSVSRREYVEACIRRMEAVDGPVQAWAHLDQDGARRHAAAQDAAAQDAAAQDAGGATGPLGGVPFGIKDIIDTADMPTRLGSPIYEHNQPSSDAACVALARKAGAIALGKTVTTEFANVHPGKTRNPFDPARTPGGSSSGSAAAVGARMVPLAIGTQTTASTIRPASFCGVYGFIPTQGRISCSGVRQASWTLDRLGLFARSVADIALFRDVLRGATPTPLSAPADAPRIAFCRTHLWDRLEPTTAALITGAAEDLARAGSPVVELDLPPAFAAAADGHRWISSYEFTKNFTYEITHHFDRISQTLRAGRITDGLGCTPQTYEQALALAADCAAQFDAVIVPYDAILTVGAAGEAPLGNATGDYSFCALWTALQVPCITIPALTGPNGLPIGVQLIGRKGHDGALLRTAAWVARALGVPDAG